MENTYVVVEKKKKSFVQKIKDKWNSLSQDEKDWTKITAIWTFDGILWGSIFTAISAERKMKKVANTAAAAGYIQGQMDAYRDMAQNPYKQMDMAMRQLEKQGKVTKF